MQNYGLTMGDYGIENLRKKQLFDNYGMDQEYDQSQDYGFGGPPQEQDIGVPPNDFGSTSTFGMPEGRGILDQIRPPAPPPVTSYATPNLPVKSGPIGSPETMDPRNPDDNVAEAMRIRDLFYKPDYTDRDRFRGMLDAPPERNQPGLLRKLSAMGIGLDDPSKGGGVEGMEKVMYAPYLREMGDWKVKGEMFEKAADNENQANINARLMAGNMATGILGQNKLDQERRRQEGVQRVAETKAEAEMIRARAFRLKQEMGFGWDFNAKGPTVIAINKTTGEAKDTGIKTSLLSEADRMALENKGDLDIANARGNAMFQEQDGSIWEWDAVNKRMTKRGGPGMEGQGPRGPVTEIGGTGGSRTSGGGIQTAEQAQKEMQARIQNAISINPEVRDHITYDEVEKIYKLGRKPEPSMLDRLQRGSYEARLAAWEQAENAVAGINPDQRARLKEEQRKYEEANRPTAPYKPAVPFSPMPNPPTNNQPAGGPPSGNIPPEYQGVQLPTPDSVAGRTRTGSMGAKTYPPGGSIVDPGETPIYHDDRPKRRSFTGGSAPIVGTQPTPQGPEKIYQIDKETGNLRYSFDHGQNFYISTDRGRTWKRDRDIHLDGG